MKNVVLKELTLRNFKKQKSIIIPFSKETEIHGKNRAGKTTIADAYFWLLYGKNSLDQSDFDLKTLDAQGKAIPKQEHEVTGVIEVDGESIKLSKVYKEKWAKKRGSETEEMTGHETTYFVNDVPTSAGDYKKKVSEIIDESISKIVTNLTFFNEKMQWKERRAILSKMTEEITNSEIFDKVATPGNDFGELINIINSGKNIEDEKKVISVKKKRLKDEIEQIPSRLDENNRQRPDNLNWEELESESNKLEEEIKSCSEKIDDVNKSIQDQKDKVLSIQRQKFEKEQELDRLGREQTSKLTAKVSERKEKISSLKRDVQRFNDDIKFRDDQIEKNQSLITTLGIQNASLRADFQKVSALSFEMDESKSCCPTCKRSMDNASEIEEQLRANFNKDKIEKVEQINKDGLSNKNRIEELTKEIDSFKEERKEFVELRDAKQSEADKLESETETPSIQIEPTQEMISLQKEIEAIEIPEIHSEEISEIREKIKELEMRKNEVVSKLAIKSQIENIDKRTNELNEQQRTLSQELADLERIEIQIDKFNKAKINLIESRINSKFNLVKFKMFEEQINGGETEACICTVDGVPYNSLNTELKINASLDIINAFQYHFGILAPVFIDGRESVTTLTPTDCQIISLIVDPNEDVLKIVNV
jgi:DNA repair exonuclease SbcCD ATPase subunit